MNQSYEKLNTNDVDSNEVTTNKDAHFVKPKVSLSSADLPLVIGSLACFGCFLIYGATNGSLGAALPSLAKAYGMSESQFGYVFTLRGVGYCIGTLSTAAALEQPWSIRKYKVLMSCISTFLAGIFTGMISMTKNYKVTLLVFWLQGCSFGMINSFANCVMPEIWESRVAPWMQGLHSCFGIGAIIGPAIIGNIDYEIGFPIMTALSFGPLAIVIFSYMIRRDIHFLPKTSSDDVDDKKVSVDESAQYIPPSIRLIVAIFFFAYVGIESSYGGWISTFSLDEGVTTSSKLAAYLVSYFWGSIAAGRFIAVFIAIYFSSTSMLRFQLVFSILSSVIMLGIAAFSYLDAVVCSILFGLALSSIFPLAMTVVQDYGYKM
jgi:MFS transporter, FHS family, Na+ dependent glucose transporter 1